MDPEIWGNLPPCLAFEIYKKLPFTAFFQLREVCKEWNQLARERRCVTDPIHKPYFMLVHRNKIDSKENYVDVRDFHGILTFHIESSSWRWTLLIDRKLICNTDLRPFKNMNDHLSVKGLTIRDYYTSYKVYDAHIRGDYIIPQHQKTSDESHVLGMSVDISVVPYTFKIILGSSDVGTQIYNSVTRSWETRSSKIPENYGDPNFRSCLEYGNNLYIFSEQQKILVYSLDEDKWSDLNPPLRAEDYLNNRSLGLWQGHMFKVTSSRNLITWARRIRMRNKGADWIVDPIVWIWKLPVDRSKETLWEEVDKMPLEMGKWLITDSHLPSFESMEIHASFCEEHVLIYSWLPIAGSAHRFVLYNLITKMWEKVEVPDYFIRSFS